MLPTSSLQAERLSYTEGMVTKAYMLYIRYTGNAGLPFRKANGSWASLVQAKSTAYVDLGRKALLTSLGTVKK